MRVLVAGCGYVGWPLAQELARRGHATFGLRRTPDHLTRSAATAPPVTLWSADLTRPDTLRHLPRDFDWVVNCVASGGGEVTAYQRLYLEGMQHLLQWLAPGPGPHSCRLLYTSSTGVYGQNDGSEVTETSVTQPATATARILLRAEQTLLETAHAKQFPATVLRVAGIYGPGRGYLLKRFLRGEARIEGNGGRWLNMIHRADLIQTILAALERARPGEIYNVTDDEPVRQRDFFRWLAHQLNRPLPPTAAEQAANRKRGLTSKRVSNHKLKTELGVNLRYPSYREGYRDLLNHDGLDGL
ncbi:MAG TPA: SDR family oxidoreductase [Verrucomicrobiota bacterium]|nr:SDR family oxidoreductase [Verrucomicrobiota bacterium]HNT16078.1 SDR family oxidoreductase [Verrucomicrobiota bacterium]